MATKTITQFDAAIAGALTDEFAIWQGATKKLTGNMLFDLLFGGNYSPLYQRRSADGIWLPAPHPLFSQVYFALPIINSSTYFGRIPIAISGTISAVAPDETNGAGLINYASSGNAGATAGGYSVHVFLFRGSVNGYNGFLIGGEAVLPDANYAQTGASTGTRIILGCLSGGNLNSDNLAGDRCGFTYYNTAAGIQDTNWQFETKDDVTAHRQDTGLVFAPESRYRWMIYVAGQSSTMYWWIKNLTSGAEASGSKTNNLPRGQIGLMQMHYLYSVNAVVRRIRSASYFAMRTP